MLFLYFVKYDQSDVNKMLFCMMKRVSEKGKLEGNKGKIEEHGN